MVTFGVRRIVVALLIATSSLPSITRAVLAAEAPATVGRIRVLTPCLNTLLDDAAAASCTIRALVARIEQSNLIVYVRCVVFKQRSLAGRLMFLTAIAGQRYVVIELRNPEPWESQVATMGHELQHAVEIADAPWIGSHAGMAQYYRQAGITLGANPLTFDTEAARQIGLRVQRELASVAAARQVTRAGAGRGAGSR